MILQTKDSVLICKHVTVGGQGGITLIPLMQGDFTVGSVNIQGKEVLTDNLRFENGKIANPGQLPPESKVDEIVEFRLSGDYYDLLLDLKLFHKNTLEFREKLYCLLQNYA